MSAPTDAKAGPGAEPERMASEGQDLLQLLSYFHFALGLMMILLALVPAVLLGVGGAIGAEGGDEIVRTEGARAAEALTRALLAALVVLGIGLGAFVAWGARSLATRRRWMLGVVSTGVLCLFFPIGTLVGGYTLTRLLDPAIRASFR